MNDIANKLKLLRVNKKLSQKEIAEYLNISTSAYGFYEQGKNAPSMDTITSLSKFYDIPLGVLADGDISCEHLIARLKNFHFKKK